ncbi:PREDICTED: protein SCAF8-like, partial [Chlamydotis macqueenii]|uniref:protein SCAF8-like n=1 Tax=Chlamydotis macqueenii TaxID=187382 RepID=UPI000529DA0F
MDSWIECSLNKFADNSKLSGAADRIEGRDAAQRDPDRLEERAHSDHQHQYGPGDEWIENSPEEKDLGMLVDEKSDLYSLNDYKPPISKAKMTQITKAAIKAIKFYKHVVQSVEKFIQKCKPEYKVPGLYVIDSIVRQSRHQFGQEKDVFAPRFSNNIISTFQNLYRCPGDDK